ELRGRLARRGVHDYEPLLAHPDRNTYTVLVYIEPLLPHSLAKLGMDLEARGTPRRVLANARDTGLPSASGTRIELS
ncbi:hypothetical protein FPK51_32035, partial [Acinetobacter baumannii]|nr:hypothetical protein [Acinetobacter baumannii]